MSDDLDRDALRLLTRMTGRDARLVRQPDERFRFAPAKGAGGRIGGAVDPQTISMLMGRGLIATDGHGRIGITASGAALIRRRLAGGDGFAEQHQERGRITLDDTEFGRRQVTVNHDESPLAWLRRRKDRSGRPMIEASEFAAGERLRADYDRAHLMPRVTANWSAAVAGKRRASGSNGVADLTEFGTWRTATGRGGPGSIGARTGRTCRRLLLLPEGARADRTRAAMASAVRKGCPAARAGRARASLRSGVAGKRS